MSSTIIELKLDKFPQVNFIPLCDIHIFTFHLCRVHLEVRIKTDKPISSAEEEEEDEEEDETKAGMQRRKGSKRRNSVESITRISLLKAL